ncbi:ferritin family protein [Thermococcus sp. JCM 11816]|uniref:ferritin family protein n=1 Tax=Thermococcus sp. (strain JCM 11816 / KS-1) TaxID=1295125 RepID=UPI000A8576B1
MNEIIERLKRLSPKELLSYAIFNEEDEAKYYAELAEKAKRKSVRALFKKMSRESKGHELLLRRTFERLFPGEEPVKVDVPPQWRSIHSILSLKRLRTT